MYKDTFLKNFNSFMVTGHKRSKLYVRRIYTSYYDCEFDELVSGNLWGVTPDGRRVLLNSTRSR